MGVMTPSPAQTLMTISGHVLLARCIGIAAEFGIAEKLADGPKCAPEIAAGVNANALYRMLRYLAANGVFAEDDAGRFSNNPASALLRPDVPGSMHAWLRTAWQDRTWDTYRKLPETIRTGAPAFELAHGEAFFDYLAARPEVSALFDAAMARQSGPENDAVVKAYPFGEAGVVVDVGGGRGGFMTAILNAHPHLRGILFDQAHVLAQPNQVRDAGLAARCEFVTGDFFTAVPKGGDVYLLKRILHDWSDADAARILKACAAAAGPSGKVVTIDAVLKPGGAPDPNKALDMGMLALLHGRERTAAEFDTVFAAAGLQVARILSTPAPSTLSLVEGRLRD
ncbi:MAG: SAM-dependent methyltransferase [Alphaproteobacteria bacterium]|nr:SAM-dependent methyltransferase [Alphaproteobacteria bacterium]